MLEDALPLQGEEQLEYTLKYPEPSVNWVPTHRAQLSQITWCGVESRWACCKYAHGCWATHSHGLEITSQPSQNKSRRQVHASYMQTRPNPTHADAVWPRLTCVTRVLRPQQTANITPLLRMHACESLSPSQHSIAQHITTSLHAHMPQADLLLHIQHLLLELFR
jgi:hypothetical protein